MDKSYILDAIDIIKKSEDNKKYKVYALVAPSISSQFTYAKLGQVIRGLKELGFYTGEVDGQYGPGTQQSVMLFQAQHGLDDDGIFGRATNKAMGNILPWEV
jgi:peptidoglycan hydrolase-like protein with peptidoglycan-binding domain